MTEVGLKAAIDMAIYYYRLIKRRRDDLGDDLLSKLITAEIERDSGEMEPLDNIEITEFATLLGGAGAETVTKLIGNAAVVFAQNPDQWRILLNDRGKIPLAVEELLRYEVPSQYNVRCSTRAITLHGVTIAAGKPVFLSGASANRDPSAGTDPDSFDMDLDRTRRRSSLGTACTAAWSGFGALDSTVAQDRKVDSRPARG